ncbi:DCC1-like thiol-disulfide oxidoreductase family protein, partial [Campylobacter jejuni]
CNLCDRTVRSLAWLDIFGRCEFLPIRRNLDFAQRHGITLEQGLTDLIGIETDSGKSEHHAGYALYLLLSKRLLLLWACYP